MPTLDAENCSDRQAAYRPGDLYDDDCDDEDDEFDDIPDFNSFLDNFLPDLPPGLVSLIMKVYSNMAKMGLFRSGRISAQRPLVGGSITTRNAKSRGCRKPAGFGPGIGFPVGDRENEAQTALKRGPRDGEKV